jgi:hypothetical protein
MGDLADVNNSHWWEGSDRLSPANAMQMDAFTEHEMLWKPEDVSMSPEPDSLIEMSESMPVPPEPDWLAETLEHREAEDWDDATFWDYQWAGSLHPSGQWRVWLRENKYERQAVVEDVRPNVPWTWMPEDAVLIEWSPDGHEVGVIRGYCESDPYNYVPYLRSIGESEQFFYAFDRYTWPHLKLLNSCLIPAPTGWPVSLVISPRRDLAVLQWADYSKSGIEFIILSPEKDYQPDHFRFSQVGNLAGQDLQSSAGGLLLMHGAPTKSVFSPSGRFIILGSHRASDIGKIYILDWDEQVIRQVIVRDESLIQGDEPSGNSGIMEFMGLGFSDEDHIFLKLSGGVEKNYHIFRDGTFI